jgi:hypothetical protein
MPFLTGLPIIFQTEIYERADSKCRNKSANFLFLLLRQILRREPTFSSLYFDFFYLLLEFV